MQTTPALLKKKFDLTRVIYYPEAEVHVLTDEKGTDVLDKEFRSITNRRVRTLEERRFVDLTF